MKWNQERESRANIDLSSEVALNPFPSGSDGKNLPAVHKAWVRTLDRKDPLEKGVATHCSVLVWRIPWTEEPGWPRSMGSPRVRGLSD